MTFIQDWLNHGTSWLVWADAARFRSMGSGFREKKDQPMSYDFLVGILILLSIVVFVWILSRFLSRQERVRRHYNPHALFQALCTAHHLEPAQRRLLKRLARYHEIPQPARLFLEPELFDPGSLGAGFHGKTDELLELRERLFAETDSEESPATTKLDNLSSAGAIS
jgi:hypothetical protein